MKRIYLDYAASTPLRQEVLDTLGRHLACTYGNPSSIHSAGQEAKRALEEARRSIAGVLGASPKEIIFTSGGTESNNLAIKGVAYARREKGRHLITSAIEHHSVLHPFEDLEREGFEVTYLPTNSSGQVDLETLRRSLRGDTTLVSVMLANNEVGTVQPLREIVVLSHTFGAVVATDAVQAAGKLPINLNDLRVDLMTLTGHKLYGPRGAGVLFVRHGTPLTPLFQGGHQESSMRPGTENIPAIAGLAAALHLAAGEMEEEAKRLAGLRFRLIEELNARLSGVTVNGHPERGLPGIVNLSFDGVDGESLLMALDTMSVIVSTGSACTAGSASPSHVLLAMGRTPAQAARSIRISLGKWTTDEEIDRAVEALALTVGQLREVAPAYGHYLRESDSTVGG